MTLELLLGLIAFIGSMIGIVTPIIKLNINITELNCSIKELTQDKAKTDDILLKHTDELAAHETRITILEHKDDV